VQAESILSRVLMRMETRYHHRIVIAKIPLCSKLHQAFSEVKGQAKYKVAYKKPFRF